MLYYTKRYFRKALDLGVLFYLEFFRKTICTTKLILLHNDAKTFVNKPGCLQINAPLACLRHALVSLKNRTTFLRPRHLEDIYFWKENLLLVCIPIIET